MIRSPWLLALLEPLHIATLVVAVLGGLLAAWWLFFAGVLLWLAMVLIMANDPAMKLNREMEQREPLPQRFQPLFRRIERTRLAIFNTSQRSNSARRLAEVLDALTELTEQTYQLCSRVTPLENFRVVRATTPGGAALEAELLQTKIQAAMEEATRKQYQDALQSFQERQDALQRISNLLDRVEAQLSGLANEVEMLQPEVLRLQTSKDPQAVLQLANLAQTLRQRREQIAQFEREIQS